MVLGFVQVGASLLAFAALALFDRLPDDEFRFHEVASAVPAFLPGTIYLAITIAKTTVPRLFLVATTWTSLIGGVMTLVHLGKRLVWGL